ncbi:MULTISPECIES: glycosyltransferase family 4 protein [unclassified Oceanispirochaeta]|uniref:glycosyltransferase family 4 protein n=1 Tax=unclassified Oceanispirochaeta TaxID=2635722 RepID=UPI000E094573|nr:MULTISPECIES: glycosyltransferase family 4 protein [unclassified Oceanispirochaeta]MBF9016482.1 glycosyltransferase family 4 protein [Oceanispirochaeta sp. M2]NPD72944.1 glycosyltransferase family 4 protein [Oceanispirochaeta sp. M1]RDG31518.1 glycosyltransferase [Oceanispirochaeta sp. M1]
MNKNIGFISFRIAGTDGVSLEIAKWAEVLIERGNKCFYLAGELDRPAEISMVYPELHFQHPETKSIYVQCFNQKKRPEELTGALHQKRQEIKKVLYEFVKKFNLDLIIPQNAITIPLNIPLAMALTEFIAETNMPVIAHHHDFFWERKRFLTNCVWDFINSSFPPHLPNIQHVVINSSGQNQLALRTGISSTLIPNVMNFEKEPPGKDYYNSDIRDALGVKDDELLILQPTRVVQRKGIEHALEMVSRLDRKAAFVISHASGDEGFEYEKRVKDYAALLKVRAIFVDDIIMDQRGTTTDGRKIYTLQDIYPYADFVTYPSLIEGFGNAFLETLWFRKPILVNNYSIYSTDIKPKGFEVVEIDDFITDKTIEEVQFLLDNPKEVERITEKNYQLALKYYGYNTVDMKLSSLLANIYGKKELYHCVD